MIIAELCRVDLYALCNNVTPDGVDFNLALRDGALKNVGNQHNESFKWDKNFLSGLTEAQLLLLYKRYQRY